MKNLNQYIQDKFELNKNTKIYYNYHPKTVDELRDILEERLKEDKNADLNDIDISGLTTLKYLNSRAYIFGLFEYLDPHDINISHWDVSNITDMYQLFVDCRNFTGKGLENWNVSNVENMVSMFAGCKNLKTDLNDWNVNKNTATDGMFWHSSLQNNPPKWYKYK